MSGPFTNLQPQSGDRVPSKKEKGINLSYERGTHIPSLDGIRGFAIILVLLFHCFPYISIFKMGWIGVDLFFVLSGFLITGILVDTVERKHYYKNFILKRVLRIFPLYYFSLAIFLFVLPMLGPSMFSSLDLGFTYTHQAWYWLYASNWLLSLNEGWNHGAGINHFWSLSIEEQFYLLWPLFILIFRKRNLLSLCGLIVCLSILIRLILFISHISYPALYMLTITRADSLSIGGCIAIMIRQDWGIKLFKRITPYIAGVVLVIILVGVYISGSANPYTPFFGTFGYSLLDIFFGCIIILGLSDFFFFKRLFSSRILRFWGKYSYSMYIFHHPIEVYLFSTSIQFIPNKMANNLLISIISVLLTIVISLITWHAFEERFLRLKKYI